MNENQDGDKIIEAWLYDSLQPYKSDIAFGICEWRVFLEISGVGKKFVIQALINQDIIDFGVGFEIQRKERVKEIGCGTRLYFKGKKIFLKSIEFMKFKGVPLIFYFQRGC